MRSKHEQHPSMEQESTKLSGAWFAGVRRGRKLLGTFDSAVKLKPLYVGLAQFRVYGSSGKDHRRVAEGKWMDGLLVIGCADIYVYQVAADIHELQKAMQIGQSSVVTNIYYNLVQDIVRDGNDIYMLHVFDLDDARKGIMQMDLMDKDSTGVQLSWEELKQQNADKIQMQIQELQLRFPTEVEARQVFRKINIQKHRIEDTLAWMSNDYPVLTYVHPRMMVMTYKQYSFLCAEGLQWGASVSLAGNFEDAIQKMWAGELDGVQDDAKFRLYLQSPVGLLVAEFGLDMIAREMARTGDKSFRLVAQPQFVAKTSQHVRILPSFGTLGMIGGSGSEGVVDEKELMNGAVQDEQSIYAIVECILKKELVHPKIIQTQSAQISKIFHWIEQSEAQQEPGISKKEQTTTTPQPEQPTLKQTLQKLKQEMLDQDQQSIIIGAFIVLAVVIISGMCGLGFFGTLIFSILAIFAALHIKELAYPEIKPIQDYQKQDLQEKSDLSTAQSTSRFAIKLIQGQVVGQVPLDLAWQIGKDEAVIRETQQIKEDKWFDNETDFCTADIKERYLLGAQHDKNEAIKRLKKTVNWRKQYKVDEYLGQPFPTYEFFKQNLTFGMMGKNKEGYPMFLVKVSDLRKLATAMKENNFKTEQFGYLILFMNEYVWKYVENRSLPHGKMIYVMDLQNMRLMDITGEPFQLMKELAPIGDHYPERLHRAYVLNVPRWFDFIWRLVSPLLETQTQQRVQVFYKQEDQAKALCEEVGADKLLVELGGQLNVPLLEHPDEIAIGKFVHSLDPEL